MILGSLFLIFGQIEYPIASAADAKKQVLNIRVIKYPNDMTVLSALSSEAEFNACGDELRDTIYPSFNNDLVLGKQLKDYDHIDIRTKVTFSYSDASTRTYFIDRFGQVLWKNKIYKGSYDQMLILRGEK